MPQTLQEWIALGLVALTVGFVLGRWLAKRRSAEDAEQHSDCGNCPQAKPKPASFKNIPIDVDKNLLPKKRR